VLVRRYVGIVVVIFIVGYIIWYLGVDNSARSKTGLDSTGGMKVILSILVSFAIWLFTSKPKKKEELQQASACPPTTETAPPPSDPQHTEPNPELAQSHVVYLKTPCNHCQNSIEYPIESEGTEVQCPHCGQATLLRAIRIS
tara:strand:- start:2858 stop:3283 length:426 start_codon:yes stop_codon:yes gene_type:complete